MVFVFFITPVLAFICKQGCLNGCLGNITDSCVTTCCSNFSLESSSSCLLICEEEGNDYVCSNKCVYIQVTCKENCEDFCGNRTGNCLDICLAEFCGKDADYTNWVFVFGLIIIFCGFVGVLYAQIVNIVTKRPESGLH